MAKSKNESAENSSQYSEAESEQRFKKLVTIALNTRPKPIKGMGPKGVPAHSKKRKKTKPTAA
jgi:hypothetical protein